MEKLIHTYPYSWVFAYYTWLLNEWKDWERFILCKYCITETTIGNLKTENFVPEHFDSFAEIPSNMEFLNISCPECSSHLGRLEKGTISPGNPTHLILNDDIATLL